MMRWIVALLAMLAPISAQARGLDCAMRDAPFSIDLPLYDVLGSPAAMAAIERVNPGQLSGIPPFFASRDIPSFANILSLRIASRFRPGTDDAALARMDAALRQVPVTPADRTARCARYDNDRPRFSMPRRTAGKPRILIFEKMTGFRDGPSVEAGKAAIIAIAQRNGWPHAVTDKGGAINPSTLRQFDVIVWNNVSGDVLTLAQRRALQSWVEGGGGFVAMHGSGGDPVYFWDWYVDTLIGARFTGHPNDPQFQDATVRMERTPTGIGASLPASFTLNDEWYSFRASPRNTGAIIIATLDEASYSRRGRFGENLDMGADHPIAWARCIGRGRSFYSAIGHRAEVYAEPHHARLLEDALNWAGKTTSSIGC